jgi:hypothetical protein
MGGYKNGKGWQWFVGLSEAWCGVEILIGGKDEGAAVVGAANGLAKVLDARVLLGGGAIEERKGIA